MFARSTFFLFLSSFTTTVVITTCFSIPDVHQHVQSTIDFASTIHHHTANVNSFTVASLNDISFDPLSGYKELLKNHPLPTKMMTGATLAVCGDAIAQTQSKTNDEDSVFEYDKARGASFAVFDMAYRALQHFAFPIIVATCHGQYLGSISILSNNNMIDTTQLAAMEQTLSSQLGIVPFLYYPAFFTLTGAIQGLTSSQALTRAKENFLPLMKRNLLFWIPVQFIQFGYIQEDLQIPFLSVAGLAWTFILSVYAGSAKTSITPEKEMQNSVQENLSTTDSLYNSTPNSTNTNDFDSATLVTADATAAM
jgi:hypothetical protein